MKHVSELELDQCASGLSPLAPSVVGHIQACPACQGRLASLQQELARVRQMPAFARGLERARPQLRPAPRWGWLALPLAAAAAGAVLLLRPPEAPTERLKGHAAVGLVDLAGRPLAGALAVGTTVRLAVDAQGQREGIVVAVDGDGRVQQLWPPTGDSAPVPSGPLPTTFRVTPGAWTLFAFFGEEPLSAAEVRGVEAAVARCPKPVVADCVAPASLAGEGARARAHYSSGR